MNNMRGRREKNQPHHQSQEDPLFDTGYDQIECSIPLVISAPTDAISQQEMLRNSRPKKRSNSRDFDVTNGLLSSTQQAFLASDENGIIVTSNRRSGIDHHSPSRSSRPGRVQASYADTDDSSTLPTFVSVGESIDLQQGCTKLQQQQRTDTTFLVSKEDGSDEQQPTLLKLVSLEPSSTSNNTGYDHDTRKRLHYKERLRSLTNRFMTSSAVGRSKDMLSDIIDRGTNNSTSIAAVVVPREDHIATTNDAKQTVRTNPSDSQFGKFSAQEKSGESLERIITKIGQAFSACSMCICLDEAVVNHEGLVINIPKKKKKKKKKKGYDEDCMCAGDILHCNSKNDESCCSTSGSNEESTSAWTDMSSLTGSMPYRYQKRYWLDHVPNDDMQWI